MPSMQDIRKQYPQYNDLSDVQLADGLYKKYYSDMPKDEYYNKIGLQQQEKPDMASQYEAANKEKGILDSFGTGVKAQVGRMGLGATELASNAWEAVGGKSLIDRQVLAEAQKEANVMDKGTGVSGFVGNLAGDPLSYVGGAALKGANSLGQAVKQGFKVGLGLGAASGLTAGTGNENSTIADNAGNALQGSVIGGVTGGVLPVAIKPIAYTGQKTLSGLERVGAKFNDNLAQKLATKNAEFAKNNYIATSGEVKANAQQLYENARKLGGEFNNNLSNEAINKINTIKIQPIKNVISSDDQAFNNQLADFEKMLSGKTTLQEYQAIDSKLSDLSNQYNKGLQPNKTSNEARLLDDLRYSLRDMVNDPRYINGSPEGVRELQKATGEWAKSYKLKNIENKLEFANASDQPSTSMRTAARGLNLKINEGKARGYSEAEKQAIKKASQYPIGVEAVKLLGNRLSGGLVGGIAGSAGGPAGALIGAAVGAASSNQAAKLAGKMQQKRINEVLKAITQSKGGMQQPLSDDAVNAIISRQQAQKQPLALPAPDGSGIKGNIPDFLAKGDGILPNQKWNDLVSPQAKASVASKAQKQIEIENAYAQKAQQDFAAKSTLFAQGERKSVIDNIRSAEEKTNLQGKEVGALGEELLRLLKNQDGSVNMVEFNKILPTLKPDLAVALTNYMTDATSYNASQEPQQEIAPQQEQRQQLTNFEPLNYTQPKRTNSYLNKLAKAESSNNPNAKNPNSTATGKYQFTKGTWNALIDKYGQEAGVSRADILNPQAQDIMIGYLDKENSDALQNFLGREPNEAEKYMAHFLGISQAKKLIENADSTSLAYKVFPKEARFNKNIFYDKKMRPLTINQVYEKLSDIIG